MVIPVVAASTLVPPTCSTFSDTIPPIIYPITSLELEKKYLVKALFTVSFTIFAPILLVLWANVETRPTTLPAIRNLASYCPLDFNSSYAKPVINPATSNFADSESIFCDQSCPKTLPTPCKTAAPTLNPMSTKPSRALIAPSTPPTTKQAAFPQKSALYSGFSSFHCCKLKL